MEVREGCLIKIEAGNPPQQRVPPCAGGWRDWDSMIVVRAMAEF